MNIDQKLDQMLITLKKQPETHIKNAYAGNYIPSEETLKLALEVWYLEHNQ